MSLAVTLVPRPTPLVPAAALATGPAARALAARLLAREPAALLRLAGVAGDDLLAVLGDAGDLPWVDGIVYLGREPSAPALFLPTTLTTSAPPPLVERRLIAEGLAAPIVLCAALVLSAAPARAIAHAELARWVAR